jgi:hypothetical protein
MSMLATIENMMLSRFNALLNGTLGREINTTSAAAASREGKLLGASRYLSPEALADIPTRQQRRAAQRKETKDFFRDIERQAVALPAAERGNFRADVIAEAMRDVI